MFHSEINASVFHQMSVNLFLWLSRIYLQKRSESKMLMQSCSKNSEAFCVSTNQKYFERERPNGWLLYFNCASMFSFWLYIFHLTAVMKNPTNSKPGIADLWASYSRESRMQEARQGAGWPCLQRHGLIISHQTWACSCRFWPFQGKSASDTSPCSESRIQYLSRKGQSVSPLNCHCTKRRQHL